MDSTFFKSMDQCFREPECSVERNWPLGTCEKVLRRVCTQIVSVPGKEWQINSTDAEVSDERKQGSGSRCSFLNRQKRCEAGAGRSSLDVAILPSDEAGPQGAGGAPTWAPLLKAHIVRFSIC